MKSTAAKNVIMEQRAEIKSLIFGIPGLREVVKCGGGGGIHVYMIQNAHSDGTKDQDQGIIQAESGEVLALPSPNERQHELMLLRNIKEDLPEIDESIIKKFEPIFAKLPEPKLESAVRLVAETAHRREGSVQGVAKALNCSVYKAKSVMAKFGLSS